MYKQIFALLFVVVFAMPALANGNGNSGGNGNGQNNNQQETDDDCNSGGQCSNGDANGQPNDPGHNNASENGCLHGEPNCNTVTPTPTSEPTATRTEVPTEQPTVTPEASETPVVTDETDPVDPSDPTDPQDQDSERDPDPIATEASVPDEVQVYENCFNEDLLAVTNSERLSQQRGLVFDTMNGVPNWDSITIMTIENADLLEANTGVNECHAVGSAIFADGETNDMVVFNRIGEIIYHKVTTDMSEVSVTCSQENSLCAFLDATNNNQLYVTDASRSFNWNFDVYGAERVEAFGEILFVTIDGYTYQYSFNGELISEMPEYGQTVASSEAGRYFTGSPLQFEANGEEFTTMGLGEDATDITVWDTMSGVILVDGNLGYSTNIQNDVPFESVFDSRFVDMTSPTYFK